MKRIDFRGTMDKALEAWERQQRETLIAVEMARILQERLEPFPSLEPPDRSWMISAKLRGHGLYVHDVINMLRQLRWIQAVSGEHAIPMNAIVESVAFWALYPDLVRYDLQEGTRRVRSEEISG